MTTMKKAVLIVIGVGILIWLIVVAAVVFTSAGEADGAVTADVTTPRATLYGGDIVVGQIVEPEPLVAPGSAYEKAGCANSKAVGYINALGQRVANTYMWQKFCWSQGQVTVEAVRKQIDMTSWGQATTWRPDGWRDGPDGWTDYGNKFHGGHFANKSAKFKGCIPVLFGCIDVKSISLRHSLLQHAGGRWYASVDAE